MLKLIIFDWDGTLVDSVGKIIACKQLLARKYNLPPPPDALVKRVLGQKFEEALAECFPLADQVTLSMLKSDFHQLMQKPEYQASLFPNARELLQSIKDRGINLAIATSKSRVELDQALHFNKLENIFDITCCGEEYQCKPEPTMLNYIMTKYQIACDECVMVGDTTTDIKFASNAGIKTICVTFGAHAAADLQFMQPLELCDDFAELIGIIDKLCYSTQASYQYS